MISVQSSESEKKKRERSSKALFAFHLKEVISTCWIVLLITFQRDWLLVTITLLRSRPLIETIQIKQRHVRWNNAFRRRRLSWIGFSWLPTMDMQFFHLFLAAFRFDYSTAIMQTFTCHLNPCAKSNDWVNEWVSEWEWWTHSHLSHLDCATFTENPSSVSDDVSSLDGREYKWLASSASQDQVEQFENQEVRFPREVQPTWKTTTHGTWTQSRGWRLHLPLAWDSLYACV